MTVSTKAADRLDPQCRRKQTDCYRVILFNGAGTALLLQRQNDTYALPDIHIPKFTRPAEQITSVVRDTWGTKTVLLFAELFNSSQGPAYYAAMEEVQERWQAPSGMDWVPVHKAVSILLENGDGRILKSSHERALLQCSAESEPFSRLGWMRRLQEWVRTILAPRGIEILDFQQLNGGGAFSLVRFETTRKPVWFKAVGKPNLREFPNTLLLAELFPSYLPTLLATDPRVNGWLTENAGESTLSGVEDLKIFRKAVERLAHLQIASISNISKLLQAGCRDLRCKALTSLVGPFFEAMAGLMEQQTKSTPHPLTCQELSQVAATVKQALVLMDESGVPDTLGHSDFNLGNVLLDGEQSVFTDWAGAYVGSPFPTFEYFLAHVSNLRPTLTECEASLREAYIKPWLPLISEENRLRAVNLSPLVAAYAYAVCGNAWRDPERPADARGQGSLRSLTRRMKQEADSIIRRREGTCDFVGGYSV